MPTIHQNQQGEYYISHNVKGPDGQPVGIRRFSVSDMLASCIEKAQCEDGTRIDTVTHSMTASDWAHGNRSANRDRLMTTKDLAEYLQCSRRHIERMRKRGMPDKKVGGLLRFSEEEVLAWIDYERSGKRLFGISDEEMEEYRRRAAQITRKC